MRPILAVLLVLACAAPAAHADIVVGGHAGYGSFTQEDLNAALRDFNEEARATVVDKISGGLEFGGHVGWRLDSGTVFGVGWSRLQTKVSGAADGSWLDLDLPGDCWLAFLNWVPASDNPGRLGVGADLGLISVDGTIASQIGGFAEQTRHIESDGTFISVYLVGDLTLGDRLTLWAHGGFRVAQMPRSTWDGEETKAEIDASGMFGRLGLRFAL